MGERLAAVFRAVADRVGISARWIATAASWLVRRSGGAEVWVPLLLGIALASASYALYELVVTPPAPPAVNGSGEIYVDDPAVLTSMSVRFDPAAPHPPGRWPVEIDLAFITRTPAPGPTAPQVRWALVQRGAAELAPGTTNLPPGTRVQAALAADPPFAYGDKTPVQVITGSTALTLTGNTSGAARLRGEIQAEPFAQNGVKLSLSLPRYGRLQQNPLFRFPTLPGALDIGLPGTWSRPADFQIDVEAGPNPVNERIDVASPDVVDPTKLSWQSGEIVQAVLTRTNVQQEANAQAITFALGAVVGAGAASILTAVERLILWIIKRRREADPTPGPPADPPPTPGTAG